VAITNARIYAREEQTLAIMMIKLK